MSGCVSALSDAQEVTIRCDLEVSTREIIQCYKDENAQWITRRVKISVRGMTSGDWPYDFELLYKLNLNSVGDVKNVDTLKESESHKLNKAVSKVIARLDRLYVPHNALFAQGGFGEMEITVRAARNPIIGRDLLHDHGGIVIYLVENCSGRGERC